MLSKVEHAKTLSALGIDPVDPMAVVPVSADISLASLGAFWLFPLGFGNVSGLDSDMLIEKIAYDYRVFSGNAPDDFGSYIPFGFESFYIWFICYGDVILDFTVNNSESYLVTANQRQILNQFSASGFRVKNEKAGTSIHYQLVVFR
jgi:hypothetical protein